MALSKIQRNVIGSDSDSDFENPLPKRFKHMNDEELQDLQEALDPANMIKSEEKSHRIFVAYLKEMKLDENYIAYTNSNLDKTLGKFWFAARNQKGEQKHN